MLLFPSMKCLPKCPRALCRDSMLQLQCARILKGIRTNVNRIVTQFATDSDMCQTGSQLCRSRLASNLCTQARHKIWRLKGTLTFTIRLTNDQSGRGKEGVAGLPDVPLINNRAIVTWVTVGCRRATIKSGSIAILFPEGKRIFDSKIPKSQSLPHSHANFSWNTKCATIRQKHTLPRSETPPVTGKTMGSIQCHSEYLQCSFVSVIAGTAAALPHPKIIPSPNRRSDTHAISQARASPAAVFGRHTHTHTPLCFWLVLNQRTAGQPHLRFHLQSDSFQGRLQ